MLPLHRRQPMPSAAVGPAANGSGGMSTWQGPAIHVARGAGNAGGGMPATSIPANRHGHVPGLTTAAGPCRHWPRRHVPRVAWGRVPPLVGGLFWQIFSEVVSFDISLVQVVSSVKNSYKQASFSGRRIQVLADAARLPHPPEIPAGFPPPRAAAPAHSSFR
jgi:hypothetical protein